MSWWKSRRSDAFARVIPEALDRPSPQRPSHLRHSSLVTPLPAINWNNESSTSLPTYAEVIGANLGPPENEARKQKLATFLNEMQYDEELRLTEARKPPGLSTKAVLPQSDESDQISPALSSETTFSHENALKVPPVLPSVEKRLTLTSIDELSDLFPEPEFLGPKTSSLYRQRPTSAPLRKLSIRKRLSDHHSVYSCPELDSVPISSVIELPTSSNSHRSISFEYGHQRFNTLPGEPYPLAERQVSMPNLQPWTIPELDTTEDEKEHQAFQAFLCPDFDPRTGLEITPDSMQHSHFIIEKTNTTNSIST